MKTCENCGKDFEPVFARNAPIQRFCSTACCDANRAAPPKHIVCAGPKCTKVFIRRCYNHKYCSEACRIQMRSMRAARSNLEKARPMRECAAEDCDNKFTPKGVHHIFCASRCSDRLLARRQYQRPEVAERRRQQNRRYYNEVRNYRIKRSREWYRENRDYAMARQARYYQTFTGQWYAQMRRNGWVAVFAVPITHEVVRGIRDAIECERPDTAAIVLGRLRKKAERAAG